MHEWLHVDYARRGIANWAGYAIAFDFDETDATPAANGMRVCRSARQCGGDPCELLQLADHVQLRQARPGNTQVHVDDPSGVVDFGAVLRRLAALDYPGLLSVEYFDLPENGWPLDDPEPWARDLAAHLRSIG